MKVRRSIVPAAVYTGAGMALSVVSGPAGAFTAVPLPEASTAALVAGGVAVAAIVARFWRRK